MIAFGRAVEAADPEAMAAALHPDVQFNSPAVFKPYRGHDEVMRVLRAVMVVIEDFRYTATFGDGDEHVLRFSGRVGEKVVEGVDLVRMDGDGLVTDLTVMIRPYKALTDLIAAMARELQLG